VKLPSLPRGHSVDNIISRLGTDLAEIENINTVTTIEKNPNIGARMIRRSFIDGNNGQNNAMEDFIIESRNNGASYSTIQLKLQDSFGKTVSKTYVYNVLKRKGMVKAKE